MDYVLIVILFYFSFVSGRLTLVESIGVNNTIQTEEHTTSWRLNTFQFSGRDQIRNGNVNHVSHYAMWHTDFGEFYGIRADLSIWGSPNQGPSQQSGAALQINCLEEGRYKTFVAGFQVAPALYNNSDVRFFTFWTMTDGATSTGCYDLRCPGYVPASGASLSPGQAVAPPSTYGEEGCEVTLSVNKDPSYGDWVLYRHYQSHTPSFLGHFPGDLCSSTPRTLAWLGFVSYPVNTQGPPMGSSHFPKDDKTKSGFFTNINLHDSQGHFVEPVWIPLVDRPDCYNETDVFNREGEGFMFYYGGPSGCIG
uniref:Uncharacterized protein n=1 Tax=Avena sativa TaxID=4498 RepID=A0ACD5ZCJ4_AVESA